MYILSYVGIWNNLFISSRYLKCDEWLYCIRIINAIFMASILKCSHTKDFKLACSYNYLEIGIYYQFRVVFIRLFGCINIILNRNMESDQNIDSALSLQNK